MRLITFQSLEVLNDLDSKGYLECGSKYIDLNKMNFFYDFINIKINIINNKFIVDFIVDDKCDIKEMEEYYFTSKVFKAISAFANKFNLKSIIYMNGEEWNMMN